MDIATTGFWRYEKLILVFTFPKTPSQKEGNVKKVACPIVGTVPIQDARVKILFDDLGSPTVCTVWALYLNARHRARAVGNLY